jgi:hypothetical protein
MVGVEAQIFQRVGIAGGDLGLLEDRVRVDEDADRTLQVLLAQPGGAAEIE